MACDLAAQHPPTPGHDSVTARRPVPPVVSPATACWTATESTPHQRLDQPTAAAVRTGAGVRWARSLARSCTKRIAPLFIYFFFAFLQLQTPVRGSTLQEALAPGLPSAGAAAGGWVVGVPASVRRPGLRGGLASFLPPTQHSPASGRSRRELAYARCAATAKNPAQHATHAACAAGLSAAGTPSARHLIRPRRPPSGSAGRAR